jgi:NADH:ubiquinone oxidoreductase subunit 2 (subunit N)
VSGILLTVISTFYYLRVVKIIFFEKMMVGKLYYPITSVKAAVIAKSFLLLFLFFVEPSLVYLVISKLYLTSLF